MEIVWKEIISSNVISPWPVEPSQRKLFVRGVKSAMKHMHWNNKYYYWHFTNASSIVPASSGTIGNRRRVLALDYSFQTFIVIMWCITGLILVFLCIMLVKHYQRRARIHRR